MLLLVDLTRLDPRVRVPEPVDAAPDVEEDLGVLGVDELGPDDAGVRPVRLLEEQPHRLGVELDVVVTEQEEQGIGCGLERLVRGHREPDRLGCVADGGLGQLGQDAVRGVGPGAGVDDEDLEGRVVLVP